MSPFLQVSLMTILSIIVMAQAQTTLGPSATNLGRVCFGAKGDKYGKFRSTKTGYILALELVNPNVDDYPIQCDVNDAESNSNWGCHTRFAKYRVNIYITDAEGKELFPGPNHAFSTRAGAYKLKNFDSRSKNIVFDDRDCRNRVQVVRDQTLQLWYGEDLKNQGEENNGGESCVDVYAIYEETKPATINKDTFCNDKGGHSLNPHPYRCGKFIQCSNGIAYEMVCPSILQWDAKISVCNWPNLLQAKCVAEPPKPQEEPKICYNAKSYSDEAFFEVEQDGYIKEIKLEHECGFITCAAQVADSENNWGCHIGSFKSQLNVYITRENSVQLFPPPTIQASSLGFYTLPGFHGKSEFVEFVEEKPRVEVRKGEKLRLWDGEFYKNTAHFNNNGRHCVKVTVTYF